MKTLLVATALLASSIAANAADISIVSMQYSADYFVPHFRLDGLIERGDVEALSALHDQFAGCRESCVGPTAILSLDSFGGNYLAARDLAQFLAKARIATVVEADQSCYSACIIAFLGGTSRDATFTDTADRTIVPGAHLALAPVDFPHEALGAAIMRSSQDAVLGGTAEQLRQLATDGALGVPALLVPAMTVRSNPPTDLATPEGVFLLDAHFPPLPADSDYQPPKTDTALLNACAFLLAQHLGHVPIDMLEQIDPEFITDLDLPGEHGDAMGFHLAYGDDIPTCAADMAMTTASLLGPDADGAPIIAQEAIMPHMRLDPWLPLSDLAATYSPRGTMSFGLDNYFPPSEQEEGLRADLGFKPLYQDYSRAIYSEGAVTLFEQGGPGPLYDAARAYMTGPAIVDREVVQTADRYMVRGQYADTGNAVVMLAFDNGGAAIVRFEPGRPWSEISPEEQASIDAILCNAKSFTVEYICSPAGP